MMHPLVESHKNLIESEARKYAKFVPESTVLSEAYKLAYKAANTFDPKLGIKFSTHLYNQLKKLSRISTKYGGTVRLPENKQFKIQRLNTAEDALKAELSRDPTVSELAEHLGMNLPTVNNLLKVRKKDVNINNLAYEPIFIDNENDDWVHFVYHDLADRDKVIFEHKIGFGGKSEMNNEELAKKLKVSPSTIANRVKFISNKIAEGWKNKM